MTPNEFEEVSKTLSKRSSLPPPQRTASADDLKVKAHRISAPALSKRRSVSGMRGLMPLALSTPSRSSTPVMSIEEEIEGTEEGSGPAQKVDEYLAEALVQDLDLASRLFAARNMTAGSPLDSPLSDDRRRSASLKRVSLPSSYHSASFRVQSLGPIEERKSTINFTDQQRVKAEESSSDLESSGETDASGGMAAPSIHRRKESVATAATSLTSTSFIPKSPKLTPSIKVRRGNSWVEVDSDDERSILSGRSRVIKTHPPTPPEDSDLEFERKSPTLKRVHRSSKLHGRSRSATTTPLRKQLSERSVHSSPGGRNSPQPRRSVNELRNRNAWSRQSLAERPRTADAYSNRRETRTRSRSRSSTIEEEKRQSRRLSAIAVPSPVTDSLSDLSDDEQPGPTRPPMPPPKDSRFMQPSPPLSPKRSYDASLNYDSVLFSSRHHHEEVAKAIPLPPEVVDTLRVSIACFPETMLLSSSLTIETIRTYSKKLRHTSVDLLRNLNPDPPVSTHKSIWNKVKSTYRRTSITTDHRQAPSGLGGQSTESASIDAPRPWLPLKHVFGCSSDFICDALYAHLVAYNYICTLVPRTKPAASTSIKRSPVKRVGSYKANGDTQEDIPRKAASVLGLSLTSPLGETPPPGHKLSRKLSLPFAALKLSKDGGVASSRTASAQQENAARDIQAGLMKCIQRLIATAKMIAESGSGEDRILEDEVKDMDKMFTRSLCEIVRISEEAFVL